MRKRLCTKPGCGVAVPMGESRCSAHSHIERAPDLRRGRLYGAKWQLARAVFLRANPLCVRCAAEGIKNIANIVDHITPHKGDLGLFWDRTNWQSLCKRHHDEKTANEDGGFGRQGFGR